MRLLFDEQLVVIEGKRTERKATATTTWMPSRSQMLRHMDAAWDVSGGKRVLGLMIVEGRGGADAITPDKHWLPKRTLNCWKKPCRTVFLTETLPNVSGSQTDSWE